jgi:Putative 2OG-Fe(II) oxygenase
LQGRLTEVAALRRAQRMNEALAAATAALGDDPLTHFVDAQLRWEMGYPAAVEFAEARRRDPGNADAIRGHALALASEGEGAAADALLVVTLAGHPLWLSGHRALATLRWTGGHPEPLAELARAARANPPAQPLWLAWFQLVAQSRDWEAAARVLDEAESALGMELTAARLFVACESHAPDADNWIERTGELAGDAVDLCRVRHWLRTGDVLTAAALVEAKLATASATTFYPYASLAWRVADDTRADWLDRPDTLIGVHDDVLPASDIAELADQLRALHTAARPYADQSVRHGTQTDRSVLLRHEAVLQRTRTALLDAVADYRRRLTPEVGHPQLGAIPGDLLVAGSWSVRLTGGGGHHVAHTHPQGWVSTAFYVAVPDDLGPAPAGHIVFGAPPAELDLPLSPYRTVGPVAGRLVVFPSTMWHATLPYAAGERLIVSFDIARQANATTPA